MTRANRWLMGETGYGRAPVVAVDRSGCWWAAWISWTELGEQVVCSHRPPGGKWSPVLPASGLHAQVTGLAIAPWEDGVVLAWIDGADPHKDGLKLKALSPGSAGEKLRIAPLESRPAHVALDTYGGRLALAWTARGAKGRSVLLAQGAGPGLLAAPVPVSDQDGLHIRPAVACRESGTTVVWQAISAGRSRILARTGDPDGALSEPLAVADDPRAISALPAVCRASDGGLWIAWQSDLDPDNGPGLVRWIELAHLGHAQNLRLPATPMPGVDRQSRGEDQGFESPSIAALPDGRLVVVGRGSQGVYRQDLGQGGWTGRTRVDEEGWQCRGRRFALCEAPGGVLIAGRERDGVAVRFLPSPAAARGAPELAPIRKEAVPDVVTPLSARRTAVVCGNPVWFGDIHVHTIASDGTGSLEETYLRAHYRYHDHFVAVADHESFLGKRTAPGEWAEACRTADEFNEPGRFAVLHAFEWTGKMHPGPGHKVVYLPPDGGPVLSRETALTSTARGLIAESRRIGAIAVPHHVGWTGANMEDHDPDVQTCFEIVSCHGAYERPGSGPIGTRGDDKPGQFVVDALDQDLRFGFVGGSDGHGLNWHHGVCRVKDSHRSGLTAVFAREPNRAAVIEALRRRRCYATSGAKIGLWFEVDGRPMGEELIVSAPVPFRLAATATAPVASLALVSNGGREIPLEVSGIEADLSGTLPAPPVGGWCYYFARLVQEDGEVAWSSPIWLDSPDSA